MMGIQDVHFQTSCNTYALSSLSNKDSEGRVGPYIFLSFKIDYRVSQDKNL